MIDQKVSRSEDISCVRYCYHDLSLVPECEVYRWVRPSSSISTGSQVVDHQTTLFFVLNRAIVCRVGVVQVAAGRMVI